jgi:hypothetical protein
MSAEGGFPNQTGDNGANNAGGFQVLTLNANTLGITPNGNSVVLPIPSAVVGFALNWSQFVTGVTPNGVEGIYAIPFGVYPNTLWVLQATLQITDNTTADCLNCWITYAYLDGTNNIIVGLAGSPVNASSFSIAFSLNPTLV